MALSRSLPIAFTSALAFSVPASAQDAPRTTVDEVFESARKTYGPPAPEPECEQGEGDEIVVCAQEPDDPDQFRIPSRLEQGDDSHLSSDMRAPDFRPPPCVPSLLTLCPKMGGPPPEPAYMIDFSTLPETPPGSDAERVGQGLAPRGSEDRQSEEVE